MVLLLAAVGALVFPLAAQNGSLAMPVTLGWNASADPAVRGYAVYVGPVATGNFNRFNVGTNLTCRLTNLIVGVTYRVYAVSYNAQGLESAPSNEVLYQPSVAVVPTGRLELARLPDGNMRLNYPAPAAGAYAVQFAATLNAPRWQTLSNVTLTAAGALTLTDASARKVPQRFYRIAHSAQPAVVGTQVTRESSGAINLSGLTAPEAYVQVQFTPVLGTAWTPLGNVVADAAGQFAYTDHTASTTGNRFYRLVLVSPATLTITRLSNGQMKLTGTAPAGAVCQVLHAPQLNATNWPVLGTVTANTAGQWEYVDTTAPQPPSRFYRLQLP
jgi:hypothetical protein